MGAEYAEQVAVMLCRIDEANQDHAISLRSAYVLYQSDPCEYSSFLHREVEKLLEEQRRTSDLRRGGAKAD